MRKATTFSLFLFPALTGGVAYGQDTGAAFHKDLVDYYGSHLLLGILIAGIVLILYSLVRYRGRIEGPLSWGFLLIGVVALPLTSIMFGMLLVFDKAEKVEFCGSCHAAMQAYVRDLTNTRSESLAAIHFKNRFIPRNQCYVCHTSFGLFGTVQAKIAGMIDVGKYYTRTFRVPIQMREPYRSDDCLKCHAEAVRWVGRHEDIKDALLTGKTGCLLCHGKEHPAHILSE